MDNGHVPARCNVPTFVITHAGCIAAGVGRAFSRVCLFVCLFVRTLKGKRLEPSTPNLVHIYSIVVARHAVTLRSKGQGHMVTKTITVAQLLYDVCCCYDCLCVLVIGKSISNVIMDISNVTQRSP